MGFQYPPELPDDSSGTELWFLFRGSSLLVRFTGETYTLPQRQVLQSLERHILRRHLTGVPGSVTCHGLELSENCEPPNDHHFLSLRALFGHFDESRISLAGRAFQIIDWDRTHQFCGRCGAPTQPRPDELVRVCPSCHLSAYPRIAPVVMGLIIRERELLLARSPHFAQGVYSAIAGYCEPGESLETALRREIHEEVGIEVDDIHYFKSQPWSFPHSLMVAFTCRHVSGDIHPQPGEIEDAQWFCIDALPLLPHPVSIARKLIETTVARMKQNPHVIH